jgi:hypothetical protein
MKRIFIGLLLIGTAGCFDVSPTNVNQQKQTIDSLSYATDKYGNCFAMLKSVTHSGFQVVSIAAVPRGCDGEK